MDFHPISRTYPLVLASASPRRKRLLKQIGLPLRSMTSNVPEDDIGRDPEQTACILSEKKAVQVYALTGDSWILGADTVVAIDGITLGKPRDKKNARHMLSMLSGREHRVITGFCILNPRGDTALCEAVTTLVRIRELNDHEIEAYIRTDEPFGKAGSYAIQGIGSFMVEGISGSYTNVVGLPLCALIKALVSMGALLEFPISP